MEFPYDRDGFVGAMLIFCVGFWLAGAYYHWRYQRSEPDSSLYSAWHIRRGYWLYTGACAIVVFFLLWIKGPKLVTAGMVLCASLSVLFNYKNRSAKWLEFATDLKLLIKEALFFFLAGLALSLPGSGFMTNIVPVLRDIFTLLDLFGALSLMCFMVARMIIERFVIIEKRKNGSDV